MKAFVLITYLLPIVFFLIFCLKKSSKALWVIFFYLLLSVIVDELVDMKIVDPANKAEMWGIFTMFEFVFFSLFFYLALEGPSLKKFVLIVCPIVLAFMIWYFTNSNKQYFDSISASIESITLIIFSLLYFYEQLTKPINRPEQSFIYSSPNFWIVLGVLLYMSSVLFLFIIAIIAPGEAKKYWIINNISNILTNIVLCIAFFRNRYVQRSPTIEKQTIFENQ